MSDASDAPRQRAARQVKQHLAALQAAGVEHLPAKPALRLPAGAAELVPVAASLFEAPVPEVPQDPDARRHALEVLAETVAGCPKCPELYSTRNTTVFGVGPVGAELCFVGEAPGYDEDRTGEPFVGAAGQLLNKIIAAMGMRRDEVYICNTIKCRPPQNRNPSPQECQNCRPYFEEQIALVKPKFICCLGAIAAQNVLGTKKGIMSLRGTWHQFQGVPTTCTLHPAYLLRVPGAKKDCWDDMKALLARMGREVPAPRGGGTA